MCPSTLVGRAVHCPPHDRGMALFLRPQPTAGRGLPALPFPIHPSPTDNYEEMDSLDLRRDFRPVVLVRRATAQAGPKDSMWPPSAACRSCSMAASSPGYRGAQLPSQHERPLDRAAGGRPQSFPPRNGCWKPWPKPELADQRKVFRIQHPDLQGLLGAEQMGLQYYSFNDLTNQLESLQTKAVQIQEAESKLGEEAEKRATPTSAT